MNYTNTLRKLSLSLLVAASVLASPAFADSIFTINLAPPEPEREVVPVLQPGYVWAPGYWGWAGDRHVWVRGRPIYQRTGYSWEPDRWEKRDNGYYRSVGHWKHDNGNHYGQMKKTKKNKHWKKDRDNGNSGKHGRGNPHNR